MTAPRWTRVLTAAAVLVVAAVAARVSYFHMRALGQRAGEGWRADVLPLSVDGLLLQQGVFRKLHARARAHAVDLGWRAGILGADR